MERKVRVTYQDGQILEKSLSSLISDRVERGIGRDMESFYEAERRVSDLEAVVANLLTILVERGVLALDELPEIDDYKFMKKPELLPEGWVCPHISKTPMLITARDRRTTSKISLKCNHCGAELTSEGK